MTNYRCLSKKFTAHKLSAPHKWGNPKLKRVVLMWYMVPQNETKELWPRARSHLHSAGPRPFHASFIVARTCVGILPSWAPMWQYLDKFTNMEIDITFIILKVINGVNHMSKEFNGLCDWVSSHWFPTGKNSYTCVGQKSGQWRRCGRGRAQSNEDVI